MHKHTYREEEKARMSRDNRVRVALSATAVTFLVVGPNVIVAEMIPD